MDHTKQQFYYRFFVARGEVFLHPFCHIEMAATENLNTHAMKKTSSSQNKVAAQPTSKEEASENVQQLVIHYPRDGKPAEWVIIELQGK